MKFFLRICDGWPEGAEDLTVINKGPWLLKQNFCFTEAIDTCRFILSNQLWLRKDERTVLMRQKSLEKISSRSAHRSCNSEGVETESYAGS